MLKILVFAVMDKLFLSAPGMKRHRANGMCLAFAVRPQRRHWCSKELFVLNSMVVIVQRFVQRFAFVVDPFAEYFAGCGVFAVFALHFTIGKAVAGHDVVEMGEDQHDQRDGKQERSKEPYRELVAEVYWPDSSPEQGPELVKIPYQQVQVG